MPIPTSQIGASIHDRNTRAKGPWTDRGRGPRDGIVYESRSFGEYSDRFGGRRPIPGKSAKGINSVPACVATSAKPNGRCQILNSKSPFVLDVFARPR